ncbi:MAG: dephospho-CoA kinase [Pseudomonadota bacterium]
MLVGLTGSIGTGKSSAAKILAEFGACVIDSDQFVHHALQAGGVAVADIIAEFGKDVQDADEAIDRKILGARVFGDDAKLARLEAILHPLVGAARWEEIAKAKKLDYKVIIADIPLLFECNLQGEFDAVLLITCDAKIREERVLARSHMNRQKLAAILSRQMPDNQKALLSDYVIVNDGSLQDLTQALQNLYESWSS